MTIKELLFGMIRDGYDVRFEYIKIASLCPQWLTITVTKNNCHSQYAVRADRLSKSDSMLEVDIVGMLADAKRTVDMTINERNRTND